MPRALVSHETSTDDPRLAALGATAAEDGPGRQLAVWEGCLREGLAGRSAPIFEVCLEWLHDQMPIAVSRVLSWGDARPGNMIWQDFEVVCITDFEGAAVGPRELDVGWWLMFDRWMHERSGVVRLPDLLAEVGRRSAFFMRHRRKGSRRRR